MKKLLLAFAACAASVCGFGLTIDEQAANLKPGEWLAAPMTGAASDIVTKGAPAKYSSNDMAYMGTKNENAYSTDETVAEVKFIQKNQGVAASAVHVTGWKDKGGDCGVGGLYGSSLMDRYWSSNLGEGDETYTIDVPAAGSYLLQMVIHHGSYVGKAVTLTAVNGEALAEADRPSIQMAANAGDEWYYGGTFVFVFEMAQAGQFQFSLKYGGLRMYNMIQLRDVTKHEVTQPSISSVTTIPLKAGVNVTLLGAKPGTDEDGFRSADYDVYFSAVEHGGTLPEATKVLSGQVNETCTFIPSGLESGKVYDYSVFIKNRAGIESKQKTGLIDLRTIDERAQTLPVGSWVAYPMTGDEKDIVCYGESAQNNGHAMAYAVDAGTLNGVSFIRSWDGIRGSVTTSPGYTLNGTDKNGDKCGLGGTYYGDVLMDKFFKAGLSGEHKVHFSVDVPSDGTYVMQIVYHHKGSAYDQWKKPRACQITLADNSLIEVSPASEESGDWYYGGTMIYKFNAEAAKTIEFDISYKAEIIYNMFQLRKVPHEDEPAGDVVEPSIGKVSATVRGRSASFALENIVVGTDEEGHAASAYDVYVDRDGTGAELMLAGQKKDSVLVVDKDLLSGEHAYTFTIVNDKGIWSKGKEVSFEVAEGVETISDRAARMKPGQWLALPMTGDAADIVSEGVLATNANGKAMAVMVTGDKNNYVTDSSVNDVQFLQALSGVSGKVMVGGDIVYAFGDTKTGTDAGTCGLGGVLYGDALMGGYYKAGYGSGAPVKFTVEVPAKGTYLMQLACHYQGDSDGREIILLNADGQKTDIKIRPASDVLGGWYYGGTFLHVFKVEEAGTFEFQLWYDHEVEFNMFQLRKVKRSHGMYLIVK